MNKISEMTIDDKTMSRLIVGYILERLASPCEMISGSSRDLVYSNYLELCRLLEKESLPKGHVFKMLKECGYRKTCKPDRLTWKITKDGITSYAINDDISTLKFQLEKIKVELREWEEEIITHIIVKNIAETQRPSVGDGKVYTDVWNDNMMEI